MAPRSKNFGRAAKAQTKKSTKKSKRASSQKEPKVETTLRPVAAQLEGHAAQLEKHGLQTIGMAARLRDQASVLRGTKTISADTIKQVFFAVIQSLGGIPNPPMSMKIMDMFGGIDPIWTLAQECMTYGRFAPDKDHLKLQQREVEGKGQTVKGFLQCIVDAYKADHWAVT